MAVELDNKPTPQPSGGGIMGWINTHPTAALVGALVLALAVGAFFINRKQPATSTDGAASGDLSGLAKDANGNPIVYRDVSDTFQVTNINEGSFNQTTTSTTTTNPAPLPVPHPQPIPHPTPPPSNKGKWKCRHMVQSESITDIAEVYHTTAAAIYEHNKNVIDHTAQSTPQHNPGGSMHNLVKGMVLIVPCLN